MKKLIHKIFNRNIEQVDVEIEEYKNKMKKGEPIYMTGYVQVQCDNCKSITYMKNTFCCSCGEAL